MAPRASLASRLAPRWHAPLVLLVLALAFWSRVLFSGQVLLPGEQLRGFAPFGSDPRAPWTILQWDALAQYFPWRHFAGEQLRSGHIPLWNPFQFCGTPFLANGQSAVFYPLNWPFWLLDTAYAFGVSAFFGSLVALGSTYALARRWQMSKAAAVVSAAAFAFCGYLSAWALLPTLFQTACWLPACLFFYECAVEDARPTRSTLCLVACLAFALLAGHAQVFFYILLALALRQPFLKRAWRGMALSAGAFCFALGLGALQLLPTLELAQRGHRAAQGAPSAGAWQAVQARALQTSGLPSLAVPMELLPPSTQQSATALGVPSLSENFGYVGVAVLVLALLCLPALRVRPVRRERLFALTLALFGLLYALATPVSKLFFFAVPGVSQMGGPGRALLLWSLGAALCAGFGLDWLRSKWKSNVLAPLALGIIALELGLNATLVQPTSPRALVYPSTQVTDFLKSNSSPTARVWFVTDKRLWRPTELLRSPRTHPSGVLPPNGAMVYGIYDIGGYDSLSSRVYRSFVGSPETDENPSPAFNGNMVLLQTPTPALLDSLSVRWIVTEQGAPTPQNSRKVLSANGCDVFERALAQNSARVGGEAFYPSWSAQGFTPETFRLGVFVSLCALSLWSALWVGARKVKS